MTTIENRIRLFCTVITPNGVESPRNTEVGFPGPIEHFEGRKPLIYADFAAQIDADKTGIRDQRESALESARICGLFLDFAAPQVMASFSCVISTATGPAIAPTTSSCVRATL